MAFEIGSTLHAVESYVQASGLFQSVQVGEPKSPPGQGYHAAIFMRSVTINLVYAGGDTRENHLVTLRVYRDMLAEQTIDVAGMDGTSLRAEYGYLDVGGTMYRMADITLPLIVNGSATVVGTGV
jgi:hypothetical protein